MKKSKFLIIAILGIALIACEKDDDSNINPDDNNSKIVSKPILDISDAMSIAVLESDNSSKKKTYGINNFYKITIDGSFEEVKFITTDDSDISNINSSVDVRKVYNLNDNYLLLTGNFIAWDTLGNNVSYSALLVNKSDGNIFDFGQSSISNYNQMLGDKVFQNDKYGNIYYSSDYDVNKLDISDPKSPIITPYLSSGQRADFFGIENEGNCIYKYDESSGVTSSNGTNDLRIRKTDGGIFEVKISGRDNNEFWIGNNGKIHFTTYTWSNGYQPLINSINISTNDINIDTLWTPSTKNESDAVGNFFRTSSQGSYLIRKDNSVLFIDTYYSWIKSFEFNESNNSVKLIDLPEIEQGAIIVKSNSFYYIATGTDLYKVSFSDHSYSKLLNSGDYEVYSMNVSSDDIVQLSGLRFSDGKKVFLEINASGSVSIIDEEENRKGIILEKIN